VKKLISIILSSLFFISVSSYAFAQETKTIKLVVDSTTAEVNGEEVTLDVPPTVMNGRTLVPLRFIAESFGAEVGWDGETRTITLVAPDLESMELIITEMTEKNEKLLEDIKTLEESVKKLQAENEELTAKNGLMDTLITKLEDQITDLLEENKQLEDEVAALKKKLEDGGETKPEDSISPEIVIKNLAKDAVLHEEKIALDIDIKDDSIIVFSRVWLNKKSIAEGIGNYGTLEPGDLISGDYELKVEAYDGAGNHGETICKFSIEHEFKKEPIRLSLQATDMKQMMGGGGPGPRATIDDETTMPYLIGTFMNKSLGSVEIINVQAYDADGNVFEVMPGVNFYDLIKEQMGFPEHYIVVSNDKATIPCALSMKEQSITPEEFFDGWEVKITFFDIIRDLEFVKSFRYSK